MFEVRLENMAALLLQEVEASELSKLPKAAQNKLERILSDLQYEIDSLKAHQEQFRVDSGKLTSLLSQFTMLKCLTDLWKHVAKQQSFSSKHLEAHTRVLRFLLFCASIYIFKRFKVSSNGFVKVKVT